MDYSVFISRRKKIQKNLKDAVAIFFSGHEAKRSLDTHYHFRVHSDFYYLTGFDEPNSYLVLTEDKAIIFVKAKDPLYELWEGELLGVEAAPKILGIDQAFSNIDFFNQIGSILKFKEKIYLDYFEFPKMYLDIITKLQSQIRWKQSFPSILLNSSLITAPMRLLKDKNEIAHIRQACRATAQAYGQVLNVLPDLSDEKTIQDFIESHFYANGANGLAYGSIVAAGNNACTLHYKKNNQIAKKGDLVLIDAGGEYDYYATDITRTYPLSGRFTIPQKEIYKLVLDVQKELISMIKPGVVIHDIEIKTRTLLAKGLIKLKILSGSTSQVLKSDLFKKLYPHGFGHYIGLDVHDVGSYDLNKENEKRAVLKAGMILTVEPGLYLNEKISEIPSKYKSIGIRIEDDILVTATGCENLTIDAPKEILDIEI